MSSPIAAETLKAVPVITRAKMPPSILRRLTTTADRSTNAAAMAPRASGEDATGWRSSTKGPCGMRYLPQAVRPKPSRKSPAPIVPPRMTGFQFCQYAAPNPAMSTVPTNRISAMIASTRDGCVAESPKWGSLRVASGIGTLVREGSCSSLTSDLLSRSR